LSKSFHGFVAVDGVDLDVMDGSIHALIGPNGAGKTTVFNLLTKFLQPTSGTIAHERRDITRASAVDVARLGIVRSFQISSLFSSMSLLENVRVALQRPAGLARQFWCSDRVLRALDERAMALLDSVGLADRANQQAGQLSYGRKRALELATTLALEPRVLLLDEPMAGMGHEDIATVARLIRAVSAGRSILMVEHNLDVVADLCDRVTVLQRGRVLAEGTYEDIRGDADVRRAYIGDDDA
jgi:branched-chain amino acid transport system ATP-binding protein